jgi:hypothetical protein
LPKNADRDGGLPGKTGFNGADKSHDRKIHPPLAIRQDYFVISFSSSAATTEGFLPTQ